MTLMISHMFLQSYWWIIISLLASLLVFLPFRSILAFSLTLEVLISLLLNDLRHFPWININSHSPVLLRIE